MCSPNLHLFAKNALNPGFIPIKDDPHVKTQQQIDYNDQHPTILKPIEPGVVPLPTNAMLNRPSNLF